MKYRPPRLSPTRAALVPGDRSAVGCRARHRGRCRCQSTPAASFSPDRASPFSVLRSEAAANISPAVVHKGRGCARGLRHKGRRYRQPRRVHSRRRQPFRARRHGAAPLLIHGRPLADADHHIVRNPAHNAVC